jgi:redox-sensing transcriptional repressor
MTKNKRNSIPPKTVERLSLYKRFLHEQLEQGAVFISSRQLAAFSGGTAVQVRQDIRVLGYTGSSTEGYNIPQLLLSIDRFFSPAQCRRAVLAGVGNLGQALLINFSHRDAFPEIVAAFDIAEDKVDSVVHGCRCFRHTEIGEVIKDQAISIGIITVPPDAAGETASFLIDAGVTGILNFAPLRIKVPEHVYIENVDLTVTLEKVAFFADTAHSTNY